MKLLRIKYLWMAVILCSSVILLTDCAHKLVSSASSKSASHFSRTANLKTIFEIDWRRGDDLPWRYNGGTMGIFGNKIAYAVGFGRYIPDTLKKTDEYYKGYNRFLAVYNLETHTWSLDNPLFPGTARAYSTYPINDGQNTLYVLGGQSYASPYVFKDCYHLIRDADKWQWIRLPDMNLPAAAFAATQIGSNLYAQGGAFYDITHGWDVTTNNTGKRFEVLDLDHKDWGWIRLPDLPGTPRSTHAVTAVDGKIYVLGGVYQHGGDSVYNVIDNWKFDPASNLWTHLRDLPYPCGGGPSIVVADRYILLMGGYKGRPVINAAGKVIQPASADEGFTNQVLVYDTKTDQYYAASPLPFPVNGADVIWIKPNKTLYFCTAEIEGSKRIPDAYIGHFKCILPEVVPNGNE